MVAARLRARSMACLGAVFRFLSEQALAQVASVCWPSLFAFMAASMERIIAHAAANDEEMEELHGDLLESTLGTAGELMRAAARVGLPVPLEGSHAQTIREVATNVSGFPPHCRSQALALISVASNVPHDSTSHARMSQLCIEVLSNEPSLLVVARALDIIFDLYCEDDAYRDIWQSQSVMARLQTLAPLFKKRWKADRGLVQEYDGDVVAEALHNLSRFIDYKKGTGW